MLLRFIGLDSEDAYLVITEFEKVYNGEKSTILYKCRLSFIPFLLKDNAKK